MDKKMKNRIALFSGAIGIIGAITTFFFRKKKKKFSFDGKNRFLYPQDVILSKTLLKLIPDFITPNQVSLLRMLMTPLAAVLIAQSQNITITLIIFLFISFSDMVDGAMARTRNQITKLGKVIDPIADKLLIIFCAILLLPKFGHDLLLITIIALELITLLIAGFSFKKGSEVSANIFGKLKMFLQVGGIAFFLITNDSYNAKLVLAGEVTLYIACAFNLFSLIYFFFTKKVGI